jgi:hypothetical protein
VSIVCDAAALTDAAVMGSSRDPGVDAGEPCVTSVMPRPPAADVLAWAWWPPISALARTGGRCGRSADFEAALLDFVNVVTLRTSVAYRVRTDGLIDRFISAEHAG